MILATVYHSGGQFSHGLSEDYRSMLVMGSNGEICNTYVGTMTNDTGEPYHKVWHSGNLPFPISPASGGAVSKARAGNVSQAPAVSSKNSTTIYFITD